MSLDIACYFPGENPSFIVINIESNSWVVELLDAILVKLRDYGQEVRRRDLRLFKTDIPIEPNETLQLRALQWLHEQQADSQISVMKMLSRVFPHDTHSLDSDKMDIIIANAEVLEMIDGLGDPYAAYKRKVKKALNKCLNNRLSFPSPSDLVRDPLQLKNIFGEEEPDIHIGRPGGAPAAIFNPALASMQQSFHDLEQVNVSEWEVFRAADYIRHAVMFYDSEDLRQEAIQELLHSAVETASGWGLTVDMAPVNDIRPGNCSWYDTTFLMLILESKNSLGLSGDALFQAVVDYSKIVSCDEYKPFRESCNFPMVLIGVTANRLEISIAVCVGPIYVTKLLTLDLSFGFHASDNVIQLARVFKVLSRHRVELGRYYKSVKNSKSPAFSCLFPNPTPIDPSQSLPKLTYRQFFSRAGQPTSDLIDLGGCTTAMYIATLDDTNEEVIVKFTARYNEAAHRLLAEAKLAPKLYFHGRVVGDLYMIVMERVDGTSVWGLQQDEIPVPEIVVTKVEEAVRLLHQQDIVFGDLRANNILYVPAAEGHAVLVDFDWPGKDGEGKYPATLNRGADDKTWHKEVGPYGIMRKNHDLWQLEQLKMLCKPIV